MGRDGSIMSDDWSSDSDSSSEGFLSTSTGVTSEQPRRIQPTISPGGRRQAEGGAFDSMIDDWMGDERTITSAGEESRASTITAMKKKLAIPQDLAECDESEESPPMTRQKKKKLVPYTSSKAQPVKEQGKLLRCYLVRGAQTQGSLIEHYSEGPVNEFLAYWIPPADKQIPRFKFTQNFGKNELVNATHGDLRGKRAYYSGICQWLRSAKTFDANFRFCNHIPGWECDLYFYFNDLVDGVQTVLVKDGESFPVSTADGVAVVPRGSDFIHYDPRFQCSLDKWVSEGSKLGFAAKLEVKAGCGFPKNANVSSYRATGDAGRVSGGAYYNAKAKDYAKGKEQSERNWEEADEKRLAEKQAKDEEERQAAILASEQASRGIRQMEEKERARVEAEKLANSNISSEKKLQALSGLNESKSAEKNTPHESESHDKKQIKWKGTASEMSKSRDIMNEKDESAEPENRMVKGAQVYIRDSHYSWIPATIESEEDDKNRIKVRVGLPKDWEDHTVIPKGGSSDSLKLERLVKLSDYANSELPLQNLEKDGQTSMGKNDMADLPNLHEAAILYNLKKRHSDSIPYTRVGDIMVAMNPFQWIKGLYSEEKQSFYANNLVWQANPSKKTAAPQNSNHPLATAASEKQALGYEHEKLGIDPHVYETSSLAYLGLALDGNDQTILVTGESGAGKTETIKIVMNHLATLERTRPAWPESDRIKGSDHGSETVNRVLRANPVFEAFGNAKTMRNDNSSRFGKFTQLQFDVENSDSASKQGRTIPSCQLAGSKCITYLLEKSRVVSVSKGERTYHIFYQLLGAPDCDKQNIWEGLMGAETSDFHYLSSTSPDSIDGLAGGENWPDTVDALSTFGINGELFLNVMRSLCIILQLGNLTFDSEIVDGEECATISSLDALEKLSNLMGVSQAEIETAMTKRFMITRGEEFTISLKPSEARDGCDALAKEVYARVFDFLVEKINQSTEGQSISETMADSGTISLLDIFGFESFQTNHYEQLMINYANERLQQKYVIDNFQAVKVEYEEEGIDVFDFTLIDNSDVMELLEGKLGLITQLNEECVRPNGSDESFVYKLKVVNSDSSRLIQNHLHRPYEFGISHYAAPIKYDARKCIERNLDKIPNDLLNCACQSTNPFIKEKFEILSAQLQESTSGGVKRRSAATKHLVATKFKTQLSSLMSIIEESRTRYIRCVKPNKSMKPKTIDHVHAVSQLESAGLVTAIVISRESFPNRLSYELIMERFKFLAFKFHDCHLGSGDIKRDAEILLDNLLAGITADTHKGRVRPFALGKTKVYFRVGALERIETIRQDYYAESAIKLQAWSRSMSMRWKYLTMKSGFIAFQSQLRCWIARRSFKMQLYKALVIQCFIRMTLASLELSRLRKNHASTIIQARWRVVKPQRHFEVARSAAIRLQCFVRMTMCKKSYAVMKSELNAENDMDTRMSVIQQNFDDASTVQGTVFSVDEGLLEEVETMFAFLRKEIVVLRKKNSKLKRELEEAESDKREIFNHAQSIDHALALSKIRGEQLTRTNAGLTESSSRQKKEIAKLKSELKTQQEAHESQLKEMKSEFDLALGHRDAEVKSLQSNLQTSAALHNREIQMIRDEAGRKQEDNYAEILRLREEVRRTQDSHQDYLSKLMDVLETTQASRQTNSAVGDGEIIHQKDAEIAELRKEIKQLRQVASNERSPNVDANKKEAIKSMKHAVKKNRENRKARIERLNMMADQLGDSIASEDKKQTQYILDSMRDAIQAGEKSNSKMDREVISMIDHSSAYYIPEDADAKSNTDQTALLAENQKLRRKLEKRYTCKKCGYKREKKEEKSADETMSVLGL